MTLINFDLLRNQFNIAAQIGDGAIDFCIGNASRQLKSWVGAEAYSDAEDDDPEDSERAEALEAAESYLAMYHALLNAGARLRANGVVSREQDASGALGGNVINQYYTPAELNALRTEYFQQAEALAAPYLEAVEQQNTLGAGTITMEGGWRKCETIGEQ